MKVTVTVKVLPSIYPCVMQHKELLGLIVLFTKEGEGICIAPKDHASYGKLTGGWAIIAKWETCCVTLDSTGE